MYDSHDSIGSHDFIVVMIVTIVMTGKSGERQRMRVSVKKRKRKMAKNETTIRALSN